jgi:hypothetical protein
METSTWVLWLVVVTQGSRLWTSQGTFQSRVECMQAQSRAREAMEHSERTDASSSLVCLPGSGELPR